MIDRLGDTLTSERDRRNDAMILPGVGAVDDVGVGAQARWIKLGNVDRQYYDLVQPVFRNRFRGLDIAHRKLGRAREIDHPSFRILVVLPWIVAV